MSKIPLPTIDTCRWRSRTGEDYFCGVLASLLGTIDQSSRVLSEQCQACCDSFPPTPRRLNPILGSLLFAALNRSDGTRNQPESLPESVREQLIKLSLNALASEDQYSIHAVAHRDSRLCHYLNATSSLDLLDENLLIECAHPSHLQTTLRQCRRCHDWAMEQPIGAPLRLQQIVPAKTGRVRVRQWAVGVTTAPRRHSTLEPCLDSLTRAGWHDIHLFVDGTTRIPSAYSGLTVTWRESSVGASTAWMLALAELMALHPQADAYALFQDDVIVHFGDSLKAYLEETLWPDQRPVLVSLFNPGLLPERGWHRIPAGWDWGTLAVIFPPHLAREFLCDARAWSRALPAAIGQHRPIPELVREWLARKRFDVWFPSPSLVQHIGATSTIHLGAKLDAHRRSPWFSADLDHPSTGQADLSDFPEQLFPCLPNHQAEYQRLLQPGRKRMSQSSVVICGIGRDVRPYLPRTAARIERLGKMFRDYRVVLYENDSTDGTVEFLHAWSLQNPRVHVISESLGLQKFRTDRSPERASTLATLRNRYVEYVRRELSHFEYGIAVDLDLVGGWSYDGIANSFGSEGWDFVGSYGIDYVTPFPHQGAERSHYDRWAFRFSPDSPHADLMRQMCIGRGQSDCLARGMPRLQVESCFGGVGLYRLACWLQCEYSGTDCEHVGLHHSLQATGMGRLYLNPSQIAVRTAIVAPMEPRRS